MVACKYRGLVIFSICRNTACERCCSFWSFLLIWMCPHTRTVCQWSLQNQFNALPSATCDFLEALAACHQHITALLLHFTRSHYILQGVADYPCRIIRQAVLISSIATKPCCWNIKLVKIKQLWSDNKIAAWRARDRKDIFSKRPCEKMRQTGSSPQRVTLTWNLTSSARLCFLDNFKAPVGSSEAMEVSTSHLTLFKDLCVELVSPPGNQASGRHGGCLA